MTDREHGPENRTRVEPETPGGAAAESVAGVRTVRNELAVGLPSRARRRIENPAQGA